MGDLIGEGKLGGTNEAEQIYKFVDTVAAACFYSDVTHGGNNEHSYGGIYGTTIFPIQLGEHGEKILVYLPGQLLIVVGTQEQIDLTQQTLLALRQKMELEQTKQKSAGFGTKMNGFDPKNDPRYMDPRNRDAQVLPQPEIKSP